MMKISTKGQYALRMMVEFALHHAKEQNRLDHPQPVLIHQ